MKKKTLDAPDVIALSRIGGGRRDVHGALVGFLRVAGRIVSSWQGQMALCVHGKKVGRLRRYEDGHVNTRTLFSVLPQLSPSAYLLRKARPLGHSSMCCAHSAGERVGTYMGRYLQVFN
jgi:hypothetical protein